MGIRIQPREIDVPEDDPFKNDLLGRKESVEVLTHLVGSLEGPCVLAVDAAWGNGKTTFLRIWAQYLRNREFPVVGFNAWETDFSGDPFVALSTELTEGLRTYKGETLETKIEDTRKVAKEVIRRAIPSAIRLATVGILDLAPPFEKEVAKIISSYAEDRLNAHKQALQSVKVFRDTLQDMAKELSVQKGHPLIVVIDELDRCRPSYAVELLEVVKHLFAVDHIVFVLAVNRTELAHSIKALYGRDFDAMGYLRRFFDVDFVLPRPKRSAFVDAMLDAIQINSYFERTTDRRGIAEAQNLKDLLTEFFQDPDLSLRRIAQAIHRLGLVFASLRSNQLSFAITAAVVLILRTIDSNLYYRFVRGEASDLEVVDAVFGRIGTRPLHQKNEGYMFEATILLAALGGKTNNLTPSGQASTPLLQRFEDLVKNAKESKSTDPVHRRAKRLIGVARSSKNRGFSDDIGFRHSVERIELLSPGLVDESESEHENL